MQKDTNSQSHQLIKVQLQTLLDKTNKIAKGIDKTISDSTLRLNEIESEIDELIARIEKICSELDQIEKEAGDELDKLILQQAEALVEE